MNDLLAIIESGVEARFDNRPKWGRPHPFSVTCDPHCRSCNDTWAALQVSVDRERKPLVVS